MLLPRLALSALLSVSAVVPVFAQALESDGYFRQQLKVPLFITGQSDGGGDETPDPVSLVLAEHDFPEFSVGDTLDHDFNALLTISNDDGEPVAWSVGDPANIPAGLNSSTGVMNGELTTAGDYDFEIVATHPSAEDPAQMVYTIVVNGVTLQVSQIAAGEYHTCALVTGGAVKCWGYDYYGQLGDGGSNANQPTPVSVSGLSGATTLVAGASHTCAIVSSGAVKCWGWDNYGQLGDGGSNANQPTPVSVSGLSGATAIAAGYYHTCALITGGAVKCWGRDNYGQLGNGTSSTADQPTPASVDGLSGATAIAAGYYHTCALVMDGAVKCWGYDYYGQLGDGGSNTDQPTPVSVSDLSGATAIAAGHSHTCALVTDGAVKCWGRDNYGQLGNGGSNTDQPTPVLVSDLSGATAIAAGNNHTCALVTGGAVKCWGRDNSGQLGDGGSNTDQPTPASVDGLSGATAIAAGHSHTCALVTDGAVKCWGYDYYGQLGDGGSNANQPTPVLVVGSDEW